MPAKVKVSTKYNPAEQKRIALTNEYARALESGPAQDILARAKRAAPVSREGSHGRPAGFLRRNIIMRRARKSAGYSILVMAVARTPKGFPYGLIQQRKRPYIRPLGK